jgi:hypothetical protein
LAETAGCGFWQQTFHSGVRLFPDRNRLGQELAAGRRQFEQAAAERLES